MPGLRKSYGVPERPPYDSELQYFKANPHVAGMAAEDDAVVMNPYSKLQPSELDAVRLNEAARIFMRNNYTPEVSLTDKQRAFLDSNTYVRGSDKERQDTILARVLSGDPSAGDITDQQQDAAAYIRRGMGLSSSDYAAPADTYHLASYDYAKYPGQAYLRNTEFGTGLAPYGVRHAGDSLKSTGYFGFVNAPNGVSTEISSEDEFGREYPLMVPTLSRSDLDNLVRYEGNPAFVPARTYQMAEDWAEQRRAAGMSPFAQPTELRYPIPPREPEYDIGNQAFLEHIRKQVDQAFDKTK